MGFLLFTGCGLVAFGPSVAFLVLVVSRRSQLVIVMVSSAFAWLLAVLLSALLWKLLPPATAVAIPLVASVLIQEAVRFAFVKGYSRAEQGVALMAAASVLPFNDLSSSLAAGLGFGGMYALIMYGGVLATSQEPADYFTEAGPSGHTWSHPDAMSL